ncbi:MAG: AAA family ATPase [Gammaproteobacteria bacterium]|nr:AAA family ATPase [Gammaproteobacteria bacterium]
MYERHFGFREQPFSLTPDPGYLYRSNKHALAYAMLEYGINGNFPLILITGGIGTGKTTLIRHLIDNLQHEATIGLVTQTHGGFGVLQQWVNWAFGLEHDRLDKVSLYRHFVDFIVSEFRSGRRTILVVDEAQNMDAQTLEELRLLTNINADKNLVLQIVLVGQSELREVLTRPGLEQFVQRIGSDFHLDALSRDETCAFIRHRVAVAGATRNPFASDAMLAIHHHAGGVPRMINGICDASLVYGYAEGRRRIRAELVERMLDDRRRRGLFGAGRDTTPIPAA